MLARYAFLLLILLFPLSGQAKTILTSGNFTGRVGVASEYAPRGIDQSNRKPVAHAGFNYMHTSGFYGDLGVTTIDYDFDSNAYAEIDGTIGYWKKIGKSVFDFSTIYYLYPGTYSGYNYSFVEFKAGISHSFEKANVSAAIQYSPDYWMHTGTGLYFPVTLQAPIKNNFDFISGAAYQAVQDNTKVTLPDWWNWYFGVAYTYKTYNFSVKYIDTDVDTRVCNLDCNPRVLFTALKFF